MDKEIKINSCENSSFPQWVKEPTPKFGASLIIFLMIIGGFIVIRYLLFYILYMARIPQVEYITNDITAIFQVIIKIISGIYGAYAIKPMRTPIWLIVLMVICAFIPLVCYFAYFYFGQYLVMSQYSLVSPFRKSKTEKQMN